MTCRSASLESSSVEFSGGAVPSVMGKVKNNFSIDHLLAKSDPVQSISSDHVNSQQREIVSENVDYGNNSRFPLDTNYGFTTPDSSCGAYNEDYMDNASEDPSEDSFDNGKENVILKLFK